MIDLNACSIRVRRRSIDGEDVYEARVRELPDVAEYADTAEEVYALAVDTIEATARIFAARGNARRLPHGRAEP